ncbi:MAG: ribosome small subunit-dependent GTPase A [Planctomycetes bacterium]|nr:ribosome small subunit-dependent GTPase A [Planctomycetota bacterium]MCG2683427.1 ribosome small subunit-dependent GTPase A [Planctomycetales bacterium]
MAKKKKIRTEFRKNRSDRPRTSDWTRRFRQHGFEDEAPLQSERISGKGELARHRTVCGEEIDGGETPGLGIHLDVDETVCRPGRVLSMLGLISMVEDSSGSVYQCATRRLLKTLSTDQRHVVAAGDRVLFRPVKETDPKGGLIERVEPRYGCLCRTVRGRQHIMVANVDQLAIVTSAAEPRLKPNLIDRLLMAAEKGGVRPLICINKIDLVDPAGLQPLAGVYGRMGYEVLLLSAKTGFGVERFRHALQGRENVVVGQSGVGKSSLLNAIDPKFQLHVQPVSEETEKGKHTTSTARLFSLAGGGFVVDTPGIRRFQPWDVTAEEVAGFFRDLRPYGNLCRFPDCTHTHEEECAVKDAVADGRLDERRYESYCHLLVEDVD